MLGSSSSVLGDEFDEHSNEKGFYSSSLTNHSASYHSTTGATGATTTFLDDFCDNISKDEDFPSDEQLEATSTSHCRTTIEYDPRLALLIENELGLNDPQTSRKNAWGNLSYAELIAKAIENSQDRRLTLSQIYSWMIQYVPYFRDKGDRKSSTGWKNSIRHNLSLHNRFVRIPNEIAGKSSWWTIDPRAKQIRGRRRIQSNENSTKIERRRLTKTISNDNGNPLATSSSFDYLFSNEQQIPSSSSNDVFSSSSATSSQQSFTSVRDMNKNFYNLLHTNSQDPTFHPPPIPTILHDMLKSSPPSSISLNQSTQLPPPSLPPSSSATTAPTPAPSQSSSSISNSNDNHFNSGMDSAYSSLSKSPSLSSQSPSPSHCDYELDQMISTKLNKQLKTMDRSSPLFRRMVVAIMRHQMNKSKTNNERRKILSTPPSISSPLPSPTSSSSPPTSTPTSTSTNLLFNQLSTLPSTMDLELNHHSQNALPSSTFDLDVEAILDFERQTFGDCSFDIHDLPNL